MNLLRDMALFVEVVRKRSFTAAAAALGMPPSTLSRRISGMERSLGLTLLTRTTRRVDLTDAGADYYARCAHLVEAAQVAHEQVRRGVESAQGTLRLSCTPDFAAFYLPPVLEAFTRQHGEVHVELDLTPRAADLYGEPLDAAIRMGRLQDSALIARRLGSLGRGLYASPGYLTKAGTPVSPADLSRHMVVRLQAGDAGLRWRLHRLRPTTGAPADATALDVAVQGRFVAGSLGMVRALIGRGAGIGVLDHLMAQEDWEQGRLQRVLPQWCPEDVQVYLLTVSRFVPARVRLFGDLLTQHLQALERNEPADRPVARKVR